MSIHVVLLPYRHGLLYQLLSYQPHQFNRQFGINQAVPVVRILALDPKDPDLCRHVDKGENILVQVAKVWKNLLSDGEGIFALKQSRRCYGR